MRHDNSGLRWAAACVFAGVIAGCGDSLVLRPLVVDVQGVSARAERVVVKAFGASTGPACAMVGVGNVKVFETTITATWDRASGAERRLDLPAVEEPQLALTVHTEDADGEVLQFVCESIDYVRLESPDVTVQLPPART